MSSAAPVVPLAGVWCRHVRADAPPLPGRPAPDGRWQRGEQLAGLYLAQDPETVWAGVVSRVGGDWLSAGHPPAPRLVAVLGEPLRRVADLSRPAALRAIGLAHPRPDRAQWPAFQDVGAQLAAHGFQGVLFRSSARPAGLCVCVFASDDGFLGVVPAGSPERIIAAPVPPRGMRT